MTSLLVLSLCIGLAPDVGPAKVEALPFDPPAWRMRPQVELTVSESGKPVTYAGVPLALVLEDRMAGKPEMAALRSLADRVILVAATDGYRVAVSAAAAAMDPKGTTYLLALSRDGKALGPEEGPVRLIVAHDPQHVRWVRMVASLSLLSPDTSPR